MSKDIEDMSPEELKAYEENLDKEIKLRDLKTKQAALDEEKDKEVKEAKDAAFEEQKTAALEAIYKEHPELAPKPKITDDGGEVKGNGNEVNDIQKFYNGYYKRYENIDTRSQYETKLSNVKDIKFQIYEGQKYGETSMDRLFINTDADTGCEDDVSEWSPEDVYAKIVWNTFVCKADLFKIAVKGIAINPGDGLGVQIRAFGAFGAPSEKAACECASCASILFTTYPLTLKQYNLEAIVCDKDIWDVGSILMDSYLIAMSDSWAQWFDAQIYSELETAAPGTTETLGTAISCTPDIAGSCCTDTALYQLYNAIHLAVAGMREGNGLAGPYSPDYLIVSPTVAAIFKRMQHSQPMPWMADVSFDDDGRLKKMSGLKVIEYCGANGCTDLASEVVAIIVDSRRAVGAVFGERPKTYKFFQSNCNSYRIDQWAYFAVGELDTDAIAHVVNP